MSEEKQYETVMMCGAPESKIRVRIKRLSPEAIIPRKATKGSAGYDLFVPRDTIVKPGRQIIPLGIAIEMPCGIEAKVEPRSGYSSKGFAGVIADAECRFDADVITGKIDSDYRDGIGVIVHSQDTLIFTIKAGQRIAQLTFYKYEDAEFIETDDLSDSERDGGFGHSGK